MRRSWVPRWLALVGFALLIFGSKLWLIDVGGSDLPTMDQWDAEAQVVFRPWLEGGIGMRALIAPHNEHRLITTKLFALGLLAANGQWSNFVETAASAIIHTLCALALLLLARRWLQGGWLASFGALLVLLFALPFGWENTVSGFQVQFYFLLLFSLGHVALTLERDRFSWRWALGQICGVLAFATMASGFFSAAAVVAVLAWRRLRGDRWTAQHLVTAALAIAIIAVGWTMRVDVPGHAVLRAHTTGVFCWSLLQLIAWPGPAWLPLAFLPVALCLVRAVRRSTASAADPVLLGLVGWSILQCAALAYGRGAGTVLSSRYLDLLSLDLAIGLIVIVRAFAGRTRLLLGTLWITGVAVGLLHQSREQWNGAIAPMIPLRRQQETLVRDYVRTGNPAILAHRSWPELPYPDPGVLQQRLDTPALRQILPPSVRPPVALKANPLADVGFVPAALLPTTFSIACSTQTTGDRTTFHWRSVNAPATASPILRFRVAGDLGAPGHALHLVVKSPSGEIDVTPESAPGARWKNVSITRPSGVWWVEATDADPNGWFAFTEPVELTRGTWFAEKLLKSHLAIMLTGLALFLVGGALLSRTAREIAS